MGKKILGQDTAILMAMGANLLSWFVRMFAPSLLPALVPKLPQEQTEGPVSDNTKCVVIARPGGVEQLRIITLKPGYCTTGYNVSPREGAFAHIKDLPSDCVIVRIDSFSVNYADICIRWGLYESANQYVGYPIVPGFDIAGVVEHVGADVRQFRVGDRVFGCTLFGAYSSRVMVPALHLRRVPDGWSTSQASAIPTVALTSLYSLFLAGHFPIPSKFNNKGILIHSAAGGVGSMLIQMSKLLGLSPVVGVVGRSAKVEEAKRLGCDVVIDKSATRNMWNEIAAASPSGYAAVMDSSGVDTLQQSYDHLAMTGRLIVFGFHTNLPMGRDMLSPWQWLKMAYKMTNMPKLDPMEMGAVNKAVLAFNLSFFANEREMLSDLFDQVLAWLEEGKLSCPRVVEMHMNDIASAHDLISSGATVGKIVLSTAES
jgi:NADPH:quinone reductase-like Zn-dependent oxidoreductase